MNWDLYVGIDYSGRGTPSTRTSALQVYTVSGAGRPIRVPCFASSQSNARHWCRVELFEWLQNLIAENRQFIAGIDHGFSFPIGYFRRHGITTWLEFLADFRSHWPCDQPKATVESFRNGSGSSRSGTNSEYRITETWTSSAKSVFHFDVQGSVAKSTHAGLPWLQRLRNEAPDRIHVWPFDGWNPPSGKSVIAETFPSIFRNRYPRSDRTVDEQDAYSVARWLSEMDARDLLADYFSPPLTSSQREVSSLEGWILGIR